MAKIKLTQGITTDTAGRSVKGAIGTFVGSDGDTYPMGVTVDAYTWELLDVSAPGSAQSPGVKGTSSTQSFTADVDGGCYRVRLTTLDSLGNTSVDIRNFGVPDALGVLIPSFEPDPGVDYTKDEFNFSGQARSWSQVMQDSLDAVRAYAKGAPGAAITSSGPVAARTEALNTTGGVITRTMPAAPFDGQMVTFMDVGPLVGGTGFGTHKATIAANTGQKIEDPNSPGTLSGLAGSVDLLIDDTRISFRFWALHSYWTRA
jgi:hypothetical protein